MSAPPRTRAALTTFAPVRRATSAQYAGPSSPCSCTIVSPTPSATPVTSSSGALTKTPQISACRRSVAAIRSASGSAHRRGEPGNRITPSAQAPASTARLASSRPVIPQNLMRGGRGVSTPPSYGLPRPAGLRRRALRERDLDGLLAAVVDELDLDLVAALLGSDRVGEVVARSDLLAADRRDDVAAEADLVAVELRHDVAPLDARLRRGAAGRDRLHERAAVDREVEVAQRRVDRDRVDAEEPAVDAAVLRELRHQALGRVDRDGEADADVAAAASAGLDLRVDADHAAGRVEERAAGVAGVDRGVGLDHAVDLEAVRGLDRALRRGHDARRERALEAERVADRDRRVADLHALRLAERERVELARLGVADLQDREVGGLVAAENLRLDDVAIGELDRHLRRARDDVRVREDRARSVDDEARAGRLAALLLGEAEVERRLRLLDDLRADEDDARRGALVDVARCEPAVAAVRGVLAAQRRLLDDRGRVAAAEVERCDDPDRGGGADDCRHERDRNQRLRTHCARSVGSAPQSRLNRLLDFPQSSPCPRSCAPAIASSGSTATALRRPCSRASACSASPREARRCSRARSATARASAATPARRGSASSCPRPMSYRSRSPAPTARCTPGPSRAVSSSRATAAPGASSRRSRTSPPSRAGASRRGRGRTTSAGSRPIRTAPSGSSSASSSAASWPPRTPGRPSPTTGRAPSATPTSSRGIRAWRGSPTRPPATAPPAAATAAGRGKRPTAVASPTAGASRSTRTTPSAGTSRPRRGRGRHTPARARTDACTAATATGGRSSRCRPTRCPTRWRSSTGRSSSGCRTATSCAATARASPRSPRSAARSSRSPLSRPRRRPGPRGRGRRPRGRARA